MATTALVLLISVGALLALKTKQSFKHDFVDSGLNRQSPLPFDVSFKKNLVFFKSKNLGNNLDDLEHEGWSLTKKFSVDHQTLAVLQKENQELLVSKDFGVISCLRNCSQP